MTTTTGNHPWITTSSNYFHHWSKVYDNEETRSLFPKETPFNNGQWEDFKAALKRLKEEKERGQKAQEVQKMVEGKPALGQMVGGSHYLGFKIQPFEFFIANKVPFHKADIIKRILRYDLPTGKGIEDLNKIKHEIDLIIQLESLK